jgi:hypothetical protein
VPSTSPEQSLLRLAPNGATEHHRRAPLRPNFDRKSILGELTHLLRTFPSRERRRLAGIPAGRAAPTPKDDIARNLFFPGCFVSTEGMVVNLQKVPGTLVKSSFLNSKTVWLNLIKCVEHCRKIKKMQIQFFWTPDEKYYNFC